MAGKPKSGWGGARKGAGGPKKQTTISEKQKKKWVTAASKFAKKHGITVEDAILAMIMDPDVQDTCKIGAAKLYVEATVAKETVKDISVSQKAGPSVGLPALKQDPALKVVGGKG